MQCPVTSDAWEDKVYAINGEASNSCTEYGTAWNQPSKIYGITLVKRNMLRYPSDTFAFADSYGNWWRIAGMGGVNPWQPSSGFHYAGVITANIRHGGAINIVFVDGHVESRRFSEIPNSFSGINGRFYGYGAQ